MIRHLFKLVWNRKRTHLLIVAEVFLSFLVVFALIATALHLGSLYRKPLGYDYRNVWVIDVDRETESRGWTAEDSRTFRELIGELETLDPVVAVAAASNYPFSNSSDRMAWELGGRRARAEMMIATLRLPDVLGVELVDGRWFSKEDEALAWEPAVINVALARSLFGDESAVGKTLTEPDPDEPDEPERRVVGVVSAFRRAGEFDSFDPFAFGPAWDDREGGWPTTSLLVRLAPGTRADFEERMLDRLQPLARSWTFSVLPLDGVREDRLRERLVPLALVGLIGAFLLLMVVLGLTGVMWQNVTRRTREIGLRRATGARCSTIQRQIVAEVMITALFGVILGALIAIQIPLVAPFAFLSTGVVVAALVGSAVFMLLLAALCGLYPGWSATRIQPAEALHYE